MKELSINLYGVIVPENAERFLTSLKGNVFITYDVVANRFEVDTNQTNDIEILGTASEKEITFDCFDYVRKVTLGYWLDYMKPERRHDFMCSTPNESFLSLIKSKGIELKPNEKLLVIKKF